MQADISTLEALLERVESCTEPDIELDAAIDIAMFGGETIWKQANYTMEMYPASRRPNKSFRGGFENAYVPRVTSSVDAALALMQQVLPGWDWSLHYDNGEAIAGVQPPSEDGCDLPDNVPPLPSLALLAATLRALIAQVKEATHG